MSETHTTDSAEALAEALCAADPEAGLPGTAEYETYYATFAQALIASGAVRREAEAEARCYHRGFDDGRRRGAARVREAVEAVLRSMDEVAAFNRRLAEGSLSHSSRQMALLAAECREGDVAKIRAALDVAEKENHDG